MPLRAILPKRLLGPGTLDWIDRSYAVDWFFVVVIWILSWLAGKLPVYERTFDLNDPLISHPHGSDTVSSRFNQNIALLLPILIFVVTGCVRGSVMDMHHGTIALCAARGLAHLITVLGKHSIGRLRPDFLARCRWDDILKECTGKKDSILSGRKSFPSGHSSTAFSGMTVLSLWLAGMTAAWCFGAPTPSRSLLASRLGKFLLTLLPLSWATFVAISRVEDYRHHKEDVVVGSLIGVASAFCCYFIFWPSPFSAKTFVNGTPNLPRALYTDIDAQNVRAGTAFELARLEEDEMGAV